MLKLYELAAFIFVHYNTYWNRHKGESEEGFHFFFPKRGKNSIKPLITTTDYVQVHRLSENWQSCYLLTWVLVMIGCSKQKGAESGHEGSDSQAQLLISLVTFQSLFLFYHASGSPLSIAESLGSRVRDQPGPAIGQVAWEDIRDLQYLHVQILLLRSLCAISDKVRHVCRWQHTTCTYGSGDFPLF